MNGKIEKENMLIKKIENKIKNLPDIFNKFYIWMNNKERAYSTIYNYISHVEEFMNFLPSDKRNEYFYKYVNDEDIESFMFHIRKTFKDGIETKLGDDIRAAKWSSINTFFKFLFQKKYIDKNPMLLIDRPQVRTVHDIVYLTKKEIESIYSRINKEATKKNKNRDLCILSLGLSTGLRVSAISNINIEDIDLKSYSIKVIEKGNKFRIIPFGENFKMILEKWIIDREKYFDGGSEGPLFLSKMRNRISIDSIEDLIKKYTNHLSKKITPHKLRSTAAMNLYGSGVDLLTIASVLGHEQVTTTQRYTKAFDINKKNAVGILDKSWKI